MIQILLVEDNLHDEELTLRALGRSNLAEKTHVVRDGAEALDFLFGAEPGADRHRHSQPRLILLDLNLPSINGLEVLRRLKSDWRTQEIPVVVFTSSREEADILESSFFGAAAYIVKSVNIDQFMEDVRQRALYWTA